MVDSFLISFSAICKQLLPILGAVALIFLCIAIKKLWMLFETINNLVNKANPTIDLVDQSIEKLQAPLDTANKYSHTLDDIHDKAIESVGKASEYASENMAKAKTAMTDTFQKVSSIFSKNEEEVPEEYAYSSTSNFSEKKDPFERDQKIYDEVAKYSAKEDKNHE